MGRLRSAACEHHQWPDIAAISSQECGDIGAAGFGDGDEIDAAQAKRGWPRRWAAGRREALLETSVTERGYRLLMAQEIERKFLVRSEDWRAGAHRRETIRQAYLAITEALTIRVRVIGDSAWLTIKSKADGPSRDEFEYAIPRADADWLMAARQGGVIEKVRHSISFGGRSWTVDEFGGDHAGLVLAECELEAADAEFALPDWIGDEVTDDPAYRNSSLV
jgi:CYTH domain-containing protein